MKIYPEENRFIKEVIEDNEYGFLHRYPVVVDVGACIGAFSMWIYDNADVIYAIEPLKENVEWLKKNIEVNGLNKIKPFELAISNSNGIKKMAGNSFGQEEGGWYIDPNGIVSVMCSTMEDFLSKNKIERVDLLKLDVESHELEILRSKYFPYQKIGTIIGERHVSVNPSELKKTLNWMGYTTELTESTFIARK